MNLLSWNKGEEEVVKTGGRLTKNNLGIYIIKFLAPIKFKIIVGFHPHLVRLDDDAVIFDHVVPGVLDVVQVDSTTTVVDQYRPVSD